jgi:hypothetical protein
MRNLPHIIAMTIILVALAASQVRRGDAEEEYVFVRDVGPCVGGFGDWPESYDMECDDELLD